MFKLISILLLNKNIIIKINIYIYVISIFLKKRLLTEEQLMILEPNIYKNIPLEIGHITFTIAQHSIGSKRPTTSKYRPVEEIETNVVFLLLK